MRRRLALHDKDPALFGGHPGPVLLADLLPVDHLLGHKVAFTARVGKTGNIDAKDLVQGVDPGERVFIHPAELFHILRPHILLHEIASFFKVGFHGRFNDQSFSGMVGVDLTGDIFILIFRPQFDLLVKDKEITQHHLTPRVDGCP